VEFEGMQEEGGEEEADPWQITINGESAFQMGGVGDEPLFDDEPEAAAGMPPVDDEDAEGEAGSDDEDTVRLIDADAARQELADMHPFISVPTDAEMEALAKVVRDAYGNIIDENHSRTFPWMDKYEKARIIGTRAAQISRDAPLQIEVQDGVIDSFRLAEMELEQNQIAFVIRRPLPDGTSEYWPVHELEQIE